MDPNATAAVSPVGEPESDEGEGHDYQKYYQDMDDKLSDGEDEYDGATEDAPALKKRELAESPLTGIHDGQIVVDLEEMLSPEEFEALYAENPDAGSEIIGEQQSSRATRDPDYVDDEDEAVVAPSVEELGDINPEDMELFMAQEFPV